VLKTAEMGKKVPGLCQRGSCLTAICGRCNLADETLALLSARRIVMQEEIGSTAGIIWHTLSDSGELSLAKLKKEVNGKSPVFDWAIGWLAREDKIVITREKRSFRVGLKGTQSKAAETS
jgi:hypothetical protein